MTEFPLPPVPQTLREMLKDYPEHIEGLQSALNSAVEDPSKVTPPFEVAIWMLERALGEFIDEAREELEVAQAGGESTAVNQSERKEILMLHARGLHGLHDLCTYFEARKETSK